MELTIKKVEEIKEKFYPTYSPSVTVVTYKTGATFHGFFQDFNDSDELLQKLQCRFILMNNSVAYQDELTRTGKSNVEHSIIIDFNQLANVKLSTLGVTTNEVIIS